MMMMFKILMSARQIQIQDAGKEHSVSTLQEVSDALVSLRFSLGDPLPNFYHPCHCIIFHLLIFFARL